MSGLHSRIRLFVDVPLAAHAAVALTEADAHYLSSVMRRKAGESVLLFNGRDGEWQGTLAALSRRKAEVALSHQTRLQAPEPDLWLAFAPIKRTAADFAAAKATELGAARLIPVITERTVVKRVNTRRLRANAKEAAEQCERLSVPEVEDASLLKKLLGRWPAERLLAFCDETREAPFLMDALRRRDRKPAENPWAILIGPEGGFTENERALLHGLPFAVPASLGPRLLRADTAAFAAIALWQAALGDWA
ncbi:MAG TPA: 16S rRNA (uracil(1498)-N(3))-methyltransferase [Sphingomonadales bacterium]|nr:16S rRNA (uracil(1498)-N(3))-methyltransferase [Sphingomonadales bacterium]